eukprot:8026768-Heterocapsa_arctica.AAC.1
MTKHNGAKKKDVQLKGSKVMVIASTPVLGKAEISMETSSDKSYTTELKNIGHRAEWGGFEHIIIFAKIYHIKIDIHSYGNDTQISDGDEVIQDKECIKV